jgi:hypothetical protein
MVQMKSILVKSKSILERIMMKSTRKSTRKRTMKSKSSPLTHKNDHTLAMAPTVYLPPMQMIPHKRHRREN